MKIINMREPIILLVLDLLVLYISLWITLLVRHLEIPSQELLQIHMFPFGTVFVVWILLFYIAGLYDRHTSILKNKLPSMLLHTHIVASVISLSLFYFLLPIFSITPKTVLVIFVGISFLILYGVRIFLYPRLSIIKKQNTLLIGSGLEVDQLFDEINSNKYYPIYFVEKINPDTISFEEFKQKCHLIIESNGIEIIVSNMRQKQSSEISSFFYTLILKQVYFVHLADMYEYVFEKVPLSYVDHDWFVQYISNSKKTFYDVCKKIIDYAVAIVGLCISSLIMVFASIVIKIEEPFGKIFISQTRVGKNSKPIVIYKFRTMKKNENGVWIGESDNVITKVGKFLRKSSIDEFPQFINILKGDLSLVGPRPDMTGLEDRLSNEIPYYRARYVVTPGLSGWAQTKQSVIPNSIEENKDRLAYDLFYIKNRSIILDIKIILRTLKTLFTRGAK
jgi:lipopolysaccharide/colanic/teichoic acid biosynthesis glycosyltransferase